MITTRPKGPDDHDEAEGLGLLGHLADLLDHLVGVFGARVDGEADRGAAEADGVHDGAGDRLVVVDVVWRQAVGAVDLEDQRNLPRVGVGDRLDCAQRSGVGAHASV